jgi:hypothetical protein
MVGAGEDSVGGGGEMADGMKRMMKMKTMEWGRVVLHRRGEEAGFNWCFLL